MHLNEEDAGMVRVFMRQEAFMPRRVVLRLVVAFVLAVGCFLASTWYAGLVSERISGAATGITGSAIPSIVQLTATRGELRRLDVAADRYERTRGDRERAEVGAARDSVDDAFERYLALPTSFPGERSRWASMHHGLAQVDRAVSDLLAGASTSAEVTRAVDTAADAIRDAVVFDADQAADLAAAIDHDRRHALLIAWVLDVLSTLLTAVIAYMAVHGLLVHQRVLETNRRLLEDRAGELELFAARVAHDIVSPLTVTRLAVESSLLEASGSARRSLERAQRGTDRVVTTVDGLLQFARAGARPQPGVTADVGEVAREVVEELEPRAREAGLELSLAEAPDCWVAAHEGVVASVIANLTGNAIKYAGGRANARAEVRVRATDRDVRIEVEDKGPGVPREIRDTLWDPHVRGRNRGEPGIGLGLATVKRVVVAHHGHFGVETSVGSGSLFWCELPRTLPGGARTPDADGSRLPML